MLCLRCGGVTSLDCVAILSQASTEPHNFISLSRHTGWLDCSLLPSYLCVAPRQVPDYLSLDAYIYLSTTIAMSTVAAQVPEATIQEWGDQGNAISLITKFLGLPENVINSVLEELGVDDRRPHRVHSVCHG